MRGDFARDIIALSAMFTPSPKDNAIGVVLLASKIGALNRPEWWRWTTWLAAGITVRRIEAA